MVHDPGGKSLFPLQPGVTGAAYITPDGKHRLWASRTWGPSAKYVAILGMNPSAAQPDFDDPTLRRDIGFVKRWGYDGLFKINYATYRSTNPKALLPLGRESSHVDNLDTIRKISDRCLLVVIATGIVHPKMRPLFDRAIESIRIVKTELWCFGFTKDGFTKHTLYLKNDAKLIRFP